MAQILLAEVLKRKKLSKRRFAKMIGARYDNIFRIFRANYDPKLSTLESWAKALKCRIRDLYRE